MKQPTPRQNEVLTFIKDHRRRTRVSPTLREIGGAIGVSSLNAVSDHLKALERKGKITLGNGKSRSILVVDEPAEVNVQRKTLAFVVELIHDGQDYKALSIIEEILKQ